jgi:leucyl-tRNA synthetase
VLAPGAGLREAGSPLTQPDRVFLNEIAIAAVRTREMYDRMLFREALKVAAYDLGSARDTYRFATAGAEGMSREVVLRYVEVSAKILSPITPHTSEHVWSNVLGKAGSVLVSGWPVGAEPDYVMQRSARYVEDQIASMRKLITAAQEQEGADGAGREGHPRRRIRRRAVHRGAGEGAAGAAGGVRCDGQGG